MNKALSKVRKKYFGASNSYYGFKSYFEEIFNREKFNKIFIIKGGPGTGKSSFMLKLIDSLGINAQVEAILCSSDPNSLDGVIIKNQDAAISFLDGTSPHTQDPHFAGVKDEIINLGDNWNSKFLSAECERVIELNKEKSAAYKTAYDYLSIAGKSNEILLKQAKEIYNFKLSKAEAFKIADQISKSRNGITERRLVSSFCKYGAYSLDTLKDESIKTVGLSGDETAISLFLSDIKNALDTLLADYLLIPSPLSPSEIEAIYFYEENTILKADKNSSSIDCNEFFGEGFDLLTERCRVCKSLRNFGLEEAQRWFSIAADFHSRLENIYTPAMDFDKNEAYLSKIKEECKAIFADN